MTYRLKYPIITKNWLPVEYIKGVPNYLSSKKWVADQKKARQAAGIKTPMLSYCWFCGRPFKQAKSFIGHQAHCQKKKIYNAAMKNGFTFVIGSQSFTIRTNRWAWLRAAEKLETEFNRKLAAGECDDATVLNDFSWYIISHQDGYPSTEAYAELLPVDEEEESSQ